MTDFRLRPARSTDAGAVGAILSAFIDDTDWMPRIHSRAEDLSFAGLMIERGWVTVAQDAEDPQGQIAGFAALDGELVQSLYVASGARSKGCGATLLEHLKTGRKALSLWTFAANTGAQRFYERHGFIEEKRTDGAGNDEGLPDILYHWTRTE